MRRHAPNGSVAAVADDRNAEARSSSLLIPEAGTHHSLIVYAEYVDPWFWEDQVGHICATTTYSYENGTTCVVTEALTAVDGTIRHDIVDVSCS
ncbi:hypothetical protein [Kocuria sabuli]|uniref:hypothetical protein n=1 Tax=Kocuria sabuli TaxID=3071448 RepID=UPI0034D49A68